MSNVRALLLLLLLSGCGAGGGEEHDDNHGYGWHFDAQGTQGLRLRQAGAQPLDAQFLEAISDSVSTCSGIEGPPPPFVIIVPAESLDGKVIGLFLNDPPLVLVDEAWLHIAYPHEVLHWLIANSGDPRTGHSHPAFQDCVFTDPETP